MMRVRERLRGGKERVSKRGRPQRRGPTAGFRVSGGGGGG